jgi:Excalibur calcium-binding domain
MFVRAVLVAASISAVGVGVAPIAAAGGPYRSCTEAHNDGRWDIPQSDPGYEPAGDRDNDGIACES